MPRAKASKSKPGRIRTFGNNRALMIAGVVFVAGIAGSAMVFSANAATPTTGGKNRGGQSVTEMSTVSTTTPITDCSQVGIAQLVESVSQTNIETNLRSLVQDDSKAVPNQLISRHVSSPGNRIKADWMRNQMAAYGLTTRSQAFKSGGWNLINPIGRLNGTAGATSVYAVGAHIDSTSQKPTVLAPGADDNGTGVVAVMEAARVLKSFEPCMKSSVDFIGFNDEEVGMRGSSTYASSYSKATKPTFKGLYNLDMVGYAAVNGECIKSYFKDATRERALAQRVADVNTRYNVGLAPVTVKQYPYYDVDSASFWGAKMPATFQGECIADDGEPDLPGYHTTGDTIEHVSLPMVTKVTKAIVAATAELAIQ